MNIPAFSVTKKRSSRGISLIIVLMMLIIIGVTAASTMRSATSEQRATNNMRLEALAQQYAESALRYCETQLQLPDAARTNTLKDAAIPATTFAASGWEQPVTWTGTPGSGGASATRTPVPVQGISTSGITVVPTTPPECVAERQPIPTDADPTHTVTVVTARGFSPDYSKDSNGNTTSGAVVWLQSILNL
jgi:type IV pilus assembly protein PilX